MMFSEEQIRDIVTLKEKLTRKISDHQEGHRFPGEEPPHFGYGSEGIQFHKGVPDGPKDRWCSKGCP